MATAKRRMVLPLALAVGAMGLMVMTSIAGASHPRPQGATPLRVPLVPAFNQCAATNRTHGPPLAFPSCNPPVPSSNFVTVGTPDANGAPAKSQGFVKVAVRTNPGPPPDVQIVITSRITDVRCKAGTSACGNANTTGGADYTGELRGERDDPDHRPLQRDQCRRRFRPGHAGGHPVSRELPVRQHLRPVGGQHSATSPSRRNHCLGIPNETWFNGKRVVIEMTQWEVSDGGSDGLSRRRPNTVFMRQGIFIP